MTWDLFWNHPELWTEAQTENFWRSIGLGIFVLLGIWMVVGVGEG